MVKGEATSYFIPQHSSFHLPKSQEGCMSGTDQDSGFRNRMARIEALLEETQRSPDPRARDSAREIVQVLLDLHAAALERLLGTIAERGPDGLALIDAIAEDELVGHILLLYGIHPLDLESRVRLALDKVRPWLESHGGSIELLRIANNKVRVRLQGNWHEDVSPLTLQRFVEEAIYDKAPDVTDIAVDGLPAAMQDDNGNARLTLPLVH
jgi:Fe-S cluster biogenesis protein NfuA